MSLYSAEASMDGVTIAVGNNGLILRSIDGGATWEQHASGTTENLYCVAWGYAYGVTTWVAVGATGIILKSVDGIDWSEANGSPYGGALYGVVWAGVFIAVGASGVIMTSDDLGATWEAKSSGTLEDLLSISYDDGTYVILGTNATVIVGDVATLEKEVVVSEAFGMILSGGVTGTHQHTTSESMELQPGYGWVHDDGVTVTEGGELQYVNVVDTVGNYDFGTDVNGAFNHTATESFDLLLSAIALAGYRDSLIEVFTSTTTAAAKLNKLAEVIESLSVSGLLSVQEAVAVKEILAVSAVLDPSGSTFNAIVNETVSSKALLVAGWLLLVEETVTHTDTSIGKFEHAVRVIEKLQASGASASLLQAVSAVSVSLTLLEDLESGKGAEVVEDFSLTEAQANTLLANAVQLEQMILAGAAQMNLSLSFPITEGVNLEGTFLSSAILQDMLNDGIGFTLSFGLDGESYTGWVMNVDGFGVSQYQSFPFNSFARIGGSYYGANQNGLYLLEGNDDDGANIEASVTLGSTNFGHAQKSTLIQAYLAMRSDGQLLIKTVTDDNKERWLLASIGNGRLNNERVKLQKGVKSNYWQVGLKNVDGADFEVSGLELIPILLKRR
jgi:hypothetical protein